MQKELIAETNAGKIRGRCIDNILVYKGIPYGASTASAGRFKRSIRPAPWVGVRDTFHLGPQCPQLVVAPPSEESGFSRFVEGAFEAQPHAFSEDCLFLNVWTPALADGRKRPVMVWCHGGSFAFLSAGGAWHDGANLARTGDVVIVSLNHRLNALGYLYLAELGGECYADSGNVGMLDIVAALEWVRDNIAAFGGDPDNVTLFGESGGGYKISVLMAMPAAAGLFHKAIVQSGSGLRMSSQVDATRAAEMLLHELGITAKELHLLERLPTDKLLNAMNSVQNAMGDIFRLRTFVPVVDGCALPAHPFDPIAPNVSANIPMLIGTTQNEMHILVGPADPQIFFIDRSALRDRVKNFVGIDAVTADDLVQAYSNIYPRLSAGELFLSIATDYMFRQSAIVQAERKVRQSAASVYMYLFAWEAPACNGKYRASHGVEVPFVFANPDAAPGQGGGRTERSALAERMSRAWVAFASAGDPNHSGLPYWPSYTLRDRSTMVFNNSCAVKHDPEQESRLIMQGLRSGLCAAAEELSSR